MRRVTTTQTGWSDDRYRSDAVNFSIHNWIGSNPLARQAGPGLETIENRRGERGDPTGR